MFILIVLNTIMSLHDSQLIFVHMNVLILDMDFLAYLFR